MKNTTSTKTNILLKAIDIELMMILKKDLETFKQINNAKTKPTAAYQQIAA